MNRLPADKRSNIAHLLDVGHTVREVEKEVGCSRETVTSLAIGRYRRRLFKMIDRIVDALESMNLEALAIPSVAALHAELGWRCPIHPEALPEDDVGPDIECRLCVRDGLKRHHERRKEEGRPILPPWQRRKLEARDKAVDAIAGVLPVASKSPVEPHAATTRALTIKKYAETTKSGDLTNLSTSVNPVSPPIKKVRNNTSSVVRVVELPGPSIAEQYGTPRIRPLPKLPHSGADYTRPSAEDKPDMKVMKRRRRFS